MTEKRRNIAFTDEAEAYVAEKSRENNHSVNFTVNDIVKKISAAEISDYLKNNPAEVRFMPPEENPKKTTIRFDEAVFEKVTENAKKLSFTLSEYINLSVCAAIYAGKRPTANEQINADEAEEPQGEAEAEESDLSERMLAPQADGVIWGLPQNMGKLKIEKSIPLLDLPSNGYNITQLKIIDAYLARINPCDASKRTVVFPLKDVQRLTGIKRLSKDSLDGFLDKIGEKVALKNYDDESVLYDGIYLFERVKAIKDRRTRQVVIMLKCTESALGLFFALKRYIKYDFHRIEKLRSVKSYALIMHIEQNAYIHRMKPWVTSLDTLREIMSSTSEYYDEYRYFKRDIFVPAMKDINEKCNILVDYEEITQGNRVTGIRFIIREYDTQKKITGEQERESAATSIDLSVYYELAEKYGISDAEELYDFYAGIDAATKNRFKVKNIFTLMDVLLEKFGETEEYRELGYRYENMEAYAKRAYEILQRAEEEGEIASPLRYYRGILLNGHPEAAPEDWFSRRFAALKADEADKPKFLEHSYSAEENDAYIKSLEDDEL